MLPLQGARVPSVVGELGSHMPRSQKIKRFGDLWVLLSKSAYGLIQAEKGLEKS